MGAPDSKGILTTLLAIIYLFIEGSIKKKGNVFSFSGSGAGKDRNSVLCVFSMLYVLIT